MKKLGLLIVLYIVGMIVWDAWARSLKNGIVIDSHTRKIEEVLDKVQDLQAATLETFEVVERQRPIGSGSTFTGRVQRGCKSVNLQCVDFIGDLSEQGALALVEQSGNRATLMRYCEVWSVRCTHNKRPDEL